MILNIYRYTVPHIIAANPDAHNTNAFALFKNTIIMEDYQFIMHVEEIMDYYYHG